MDLRDVLAATADRMLDGVGAIVTVTRPTAAHEVDTDPLTFEPIGAADAVYVWSGAGLVGGREPVARTETGEVVARTDTRIRLPESADTVKPGDILTVTGGAYDGETFVVVELGARSHLSPWRNLRARRDERVG